MPKLPTIPFTYGEQNIVEMNTDREDWMIELTSESGAKYIVFPEEITQ